MNRYEYRIIKYTRTEENIIGEDFKPVKIIKWTATEIPQIEYRDKDENNGYPKWNWQPL